MSRTNDNRFIAKLLGYLLIIILVCGNGCPNGPDPNGPDPNGPDPNGPEWDEFVSYLTKDTWEIDYAINTCSLDTITSDYTNFTVAFSKNDAKSDIIRVVLDYTSSNGSPAFNTTGELSLSVFDLLNNQISSTRDDSVIVEFKNLYINISSGNVLDFVVKSIIECDSSSNIVNQNILKVAAKGDISFRVRR